MSIGARKNEIETLPLEQGLDLRQKFYCATSQGKIPMWLRRKTASRTLLIIFHGAVDRTRRETPVFMGAFPVTSDDNPNQLMIADPSMEIPGEQTLCWYAGSEGFELQKAFLDIIKKTVEHLGIEQVIFTGSSGGGFASLYYSWHIPESICIAVSPQTNILKYYSGHVKRYMAACWPSLSTSKELSKKICANVADLYRDKASNTVIIIHSSGDKFHLANHVAPFAEAITSTDASRFILQCDYWGVPDHSKSVPVDEVTHWLNTVLANPKASVPELLTAWHASKPETLTSALPSAPPPVPERKNNRDANDLLLASTLTTSLLADR